MLHEAYGLQWVHRLGTKPRAYFPPSWDTPGIIKYAQQNFPAPEKVHVCVHEPCIKHMNIMNAKASPFPKLEMVATAGQCY